MFKYGQLIIIFKSGSKVDCAIKQTNNNLDHLVLIYLLYLCLFVCAFMYTTVSET